MNNDIILKSLIRKLKETLSPIKEDAVEKARRNYRNHFTNAGRAQNPRNWVLQWKTLFLTAKSYQVNKVEGFLAITDFLIAIRKKMAPNWAHNFILSQNNKIVWNKEQKTLFEYEKAFQRIVQSQFTNGAQGRVFFTSSSLGELGQTSKGLGKQANNQTKRKNHDCPCRKKDNARKHPWKPKECRKVVLALENEPGKSTKITSEIVKHIIKRLKEP
jgi:hypothetical protein